MFSFSYLLLIDRPDVYAQSAKELWQYGMTKIGNLKISPSKGCKNPTGAFYDDDGREKVSGLDWVTLASIRDSENAIMSYSEVDDQVAGITMWGALTEWFEKVGYIKIYNCIIFLIVGCGNSTPKIMPSQLPDAKINKMYYQVIQISGGALDAKTTGVIINPTDSGLSWRPKTWNQEWNGETFKKEDFHNITIYGKPLKKGRVTIKVSGFTYGTMYPGKDFHKTYEIEVN